MGGRLMTTKHFQRKQILVITKSLKLSHSHRIHGTGIIYPNLPYKSTIHVGK